LARRTARQIDLRQTKVQNLGVSALGDKNVCWLNVAMHDASGVGSVQRVGDVDGERE
jgi:hypothetical protein